MAVGDVHGEMECPPSPIPSHPAAPFTPLPRPLRTSHAAPGQPSGFIIGGDIQNSHASPGHRAPRHSQGLAQKRGERRDCECPTAGSIPQELPRSGIRPPGSCRCPTAGSIPPGAVGAPQQDPSPRGLVAGTEGDGRDSGNGSFCPLVHNVYKYRGCVYPSYVYMYIGGLCRGDRHPRGDHHRGARPFT